MPFNINTFKQNGLVFGGARPSLFEVLLSVPKTIDLNLATENRFRFLCRAAELPEMTVSNIEIPYFGRKIKVAGERTYADWSTTVMNDEDFTVRAMFEAWSNAINRVVANVRDPRLRDAVSSEMYKTTIQINQYGKEGTLIRSYELVGAFPTQIGAIALDWESGNAIETFTVNFAYDYWLPTIGTELSGSNYIAAALTDGPVGGA